MKKIAIICAVIFIFFSSCAKFLEEKSVSNASYDLLKIKSGMEDAVTGVYQNMRWYVGGERFYTLVDIGTDFEWVGRDGVGYAPLHQYTSLLAPGFSPFSDFWNCGFTGINRANTALMIMPEVAGMTDEVKARRTGELKFMRAYYYFDLVQQFGKIPLITRGNITEVITSFKMSPVADIYTQIISDLRAAFDALPGDKQHNTEGRGRATKWAASHLLAKVYLTRGSAVKDIRGQKATDMDSAAYYAELVINSGKLSLQSDYKDYFDVKSQPSSPEIIWDVEFTTDVLFRESGNRMHGYWICPYENLPGLDRDVLNGHAYARMRPTPYVLDTLYNKLNDSRFYKSYQLAYLCNATADIPKWQDKYYLNNDKTKEVIYTTPAELVGKLKFGLGDTAALMLLKYYGAKDANGKVIDVAKDRQMQIDIAKSPYTLIPIDNITSSIYPVLQKWVDPQLIGTDINSSRPFIRMRLGETYLIAAEAYGRKGNFSKAKDYINILRRRAGYADGEKKPYQWLGLSGANAANYLKSTKSALEVSEADISTNFTGFILDERARELYGELNRWEDLVRTETLVSRVKRYSPDVTAKANIKDYHMLRPIPRSHIDGLLPKPPIEEVQNVGYY